MREVKFRVWNKVGQTMNYAMHLAIYKTGLQAIYYCNTQFEDQPQLENLELMQSTLFKDKNGMDIFEGDIIRSKTVATKSSEVIEYVHLVEWNNLSFHFKSLDSGYKGLNSVTMLHSPEQVEIIGNIHENKELLKWLV